MKKTIFKLTESCKEKEEKYFLTLKSDNVMYPTTEIVISFVDNEYAGIFYNKEIIDISQRESLEIINLVRNYVMIIEEQYNNKCLNEIKENERR